jgi:hypothetical protein
MYCMLLSKCKMEMSRFSTEGIKHDGSQGKEESKCYSGKRRDERTRETRVSEYISGRPQVKRIGLSYCML